MRQIFSLLLFVMVALSAYSSERGGGSEDFHYEVEITTNMGKINIFLDNRTPLHRDNFLKLIDFDYYDNMLFHRVIKGHVIQAGDPASAEHEKFVMYGDGGYKYNVKAEIRDDLYHVRGAVGMAREGNDVNPEKESSGSHFYIVLGDNGVVEADLPADIDPEVKAIYLKEGGRPHLDGEYTIFGHVVSGMDVVDKIGGMTTDSNDRPIYDAIIEDVRVFKKAN